MFKIVHHTINLGNLLGLRTIEIEEKYNRIEKEEIIINSWYIFRNFQNTLLRIKEVRKSPNRIKGKEIGRWDKFQQHHSILLSI